MNHSESIAALSAALAKAQGVMEGATKDSSNPFFKSKYADLSSVWDACRKPLTDNGLSVVQTADFMPEHPDMVCVETILCHSTGEWIKGRLAVKPAKPDPQSVGSCITYLRRYSLQSMVGIAPEDDDGNAASGQASKPQTKKIVAPPPVVEAEDVPDPLPSAKTMDNYVYPVHCDCGWIGFSDDCSYHKCPNCGARVIKDKDTLTISEPQQKRLFARAKAAGWPNAELKSYLQEVHGLSSTKEIPTGLYDQIVEWVDAHTGYTPKEAAA